MDDKSKQSTNVNNGPTKRTVMAHYHELSDEKHEYQEEWVEIIEPRSKTRIYANLDSGLCATSPPDGANVRKSDDFSDHWWELYDNKSAKYYYYNPEQRKTSWTKPEEGSSNSELLQSKNINSFNHNNSAKKRLLIIPVSRLQTLKKNSTDQYHIEIVKCDASTQTNISKNNSVSVSTQTNSEGDSKHDKLYSFRPSINIHNRRQHYDETKQSLNNQLTTRPNNQHNSSKGLEEVQNGIQSINLEHDYDGDEEDDCKSSENTSTSIAGEESNQVWKSLTDRESPDSSSQHIPLAINQNLTCQTSSPMNNLVFKDLINDEIDPSSCMSQQLDHRKLVENFKKSRQSSLLGTHHDLGKTYKLDHGHNSASQIFRNMADNYFNNNSHGNHDDRANSDRHLRQLSTLSTLPRPRKETKDKIALSRPQESSLVIDADYDVVEENCGYHSDSEQQLKADDVSFRLNMKSSLDSKDSLIPDNSSFDRNISTRGSTFSVESFARENLYKHGKKGVGLFNRKVNWSRMISWTKSGIKHPMISSLSSDLNSDSIATFKLIQQFMGDREISMNKKYRQLIESTPAKLEDEHQKIATSLHESSKNLPRSGSSSLNINKNHSTNSQSEQSNNVPDRLKDEVAYELVSKGCLKSGLRDEIFIQLARQLTENPSQESIRLGLILMSILLSYFCPSTKFAPFILSFLECHQHSVARDVCLPRLNRRLNQNCPTYCRKPSNGNELNIVRLSVTRWPQYCGVFGESLDRIMILQHCSPYLQTLRLPWILSTLGQKLLNTEGAATEGIFRCAADHDLIAQLRLEIDCVDFRKITDSKQVQSLLSNVQDPHVIAGLLKLFFRQLKEPVFPTHIYELCLQNSHDGHKACRIFNEHLSNINKDVAAYLIRLLQYLAKPEQVTQTKMDNSNLSMVWAPNLLRSPQRDDNTQGISDSKWSISNWNPLDENSANHPGLAQSSIFEQTRQEMQFIRSLITHLDTSFIENII